MKKFLISILALALLATLSVFPAFGEETNISGIRYEGTSTTIGSETPNVYMRDANSNVLWAEGTTVPTDGTAGYAKGAIFVDTDVSTGSSGIYENIGTTTSCNFDVVGATPGAGVTYTTPILNAPNIDFAQQSAAQVLIFNGTTQDWHPKSLSNVITIDSDGVTTIASGVTYTTPILNAPNLDFAQQSDAQVLVYNSTTEDWHPKSLSNVITVDNNGVTSVASSVTFTTPILNAPNIDYAQQSDAQVLVYNSTTEDWHPKSLSNVITIDNNGVTSIASGVTHTTPILNAPNIDFAQQSAGQMLIFNGTTQDWHPKSLSNDITIDSDGVTTLTVNTVSYAEAFTNSCLIDIDDTESSGTCGVYLNTTDDMIINIIPIANLNNIALEMYNGVSISGSTLTLTVNGTVSAPSVRYKVVVWRPTN